MPKNDLPLAAGAFVRVREHIRGTLCCLPFSAYSSDQTIFLYTTQFKISYTFQLL